MKQLHNGSVFILGLLWLLIADLASAGDYVLVMGKGFEVCEAYLKNLNAFPDHSPMVCNRPLSPKIQELSKPAWQPIDILKNLDLIRQVEQTLRGMTDEQWEIQKDRWLVQTHEAVVRQLLTLSTVRLDVDRDGTEEIVVQYEQTACNPTDQGMYANPYGREFYVLTPDQQNLDPWKSGNFNVLGGRHELFLYKEHVYITGWAGSLNFHGGELWVASPAHLPGMNKQSCKFLYKPKKNWKHS